MITFRAPRVDAIIDAGIRARKYVSWRTSFRVSKLDSE